MTDQLPLDASLRGPRDEPTPSSLGPRQELVLAALRERGLTDDEAGAIVHASRGRHAEDIRCDWCAKEGRGVLVSLRRRGLCTRKRTGVWVLKGVQGAGSASPVSAADDTYNKFPEGF